MFENTSFISSILADWYNKNKRNLPWRDTTDPYFIWLSEIILQQTRVAQGYEYYQRFVDTFPNIKDLAAASEDQVLKLWQGLGYYSRARNLHHTAQTIATKYNGVFPSEYKDIIALKGIGEYTAAAIASFSFNQPYAVVDGNVFRVLSRIFAITTPIDTTQGKNEFTILANQLLDPKKPALHNQAIMEFGALQCVPASPNCTICPLANTCAAYSQNAIADYPKKQGKTKVKERFFNYFDIKCDNHTYINRRTANDIWKNLYELPLIETDTKLGLEELLSTNLFKELVKDAGKINIQRTGISLKHILSHRIIYAEFYKIEIEYSQHLKQNYTEVNVADVDDYAVSRLTHKYLEQQERR